VPQPVACPDLAQYRQLAAGRLTDADEAVLLEHLERCESCARKVETLVEQDTLVDLIRRGLAPVQPAADGVIGRLVERLSELRPGEPAPAPSLVFACPRCGKGLKVNGELADRDVMCPGCRQVVRVRAAAAALHERGRHAAPSAPGGPFSPEKGSRSGASTVNEVRAPDGATGAGTDRPRPAGDESKDLSDFLTPPQAPDELGRLGPYRVLQVLGAGGMGVVFRAEDPHLARLVALKAMLPSLAARESARQRFLREARAAAALKHDHVVTVYQVGEDRGVPYLAMELLEGEPLDARVRREGKLPVPEVLRIGRETALGLAAAHRRGLIHRDIKPANLWLEAHGETGASTAGGRVKVLDFGLARAVDEEAHLTQQGAVVGTPAYMAPEQGQGRSVDHRCDLFSLGCVLYLLATGEPPFKGTAVVSTLMAVATENPSPPHALDPALPPGLSELIMRLLAKDRAGRPPSAQAVAETLGHIAAGLAASPAAPSTSPAPQTASRPRKKGPVAAGLAACLLLGLAGLWAAGVLRLKTPDGTIVVESLPADAEVFVDGDKVALKLPGDGKLIEIQAAPGKRKLEIKAAGFRMETREVTLASGERKPIDIRLEPVAAAPDGAAEPREASPLTASPTLAALRRDRLPPDVLTWAGDGDPARAPASLVGAFGEVEPVQTEVVRSLAFSPDGRWLASASWDKTVFLRDLATGRVKRVLKGHTGWVTSVAFSGDGRTLVSASQDGTMKLWPVDKEEEPKTLQPDLGGIWEMTVSADGRFVAAGGTDGPLKLWKWGQWDAPVTIPGPAGKSAAGFNGGRNASLALSADGELVAVAREEEKRPAAIRILRTADGNLVQSLPIDGAPPVDVAFSSDGKRLAALEDKMVFIWDLASGKHVAAFPRAQFGTVALSPDGKTLAIAISFRVFLYDVPSQKQERVLPALGDGFPVVFSPDGKLLAGGFQTGMVHVWDTTDWKERYVERGHLHYVRGVALGPDGGTFLSVGDDGTLRRWNVARPGENQILGRFNSSDGPPASVASSPDGRRFVLIVTGEGYWGGPAVMSVWDAASAKVMWSLPLAPSCTAFSPDGKTLVGACADGTLRLWDPEDGREEHRFTSPPRAVSGVAFSKDGNLLAAVSPDKDGSVKIWNVASGAVLHSWQDTAMSAAAFRPDGRALAVGHADGTIGLWDLAAGKKERTLSGHSAWVQSLKFTPDGKTLISCGQDGTVRLWNPDRERARQVIYLGPPNQRLAMDLDPSGQYLLVAGHSPVIAVLRLPRDGNQAPP
jgi:WD40 repeat protein/serine/threonine protein kinase